MRLLDHTHLLPAPSTDDAAARRTLRDQIARLDDELAALGTPMPAPVEAGGGAALLSLADLERTRDALASRAAARRRELDAQGLREEEARRAREELLLDPARHRFARVTNADVGECGCRDWHVRPRFGLLGMLAGWWRVVISSGCPLAGAPAEGAARGWTDGWWRGFVGPRLLSTTGERGVFSSAAEKPVPGGVDTLSG